MADNENTASSGTVNQWYYLLPLLVAVISFAMMVWVIAMRWDYPYQLDWIEGSVMHHVVRIIEGRPVYQWPDMTYAPALYTPFYYYLSAATASIMGNGLPALRLVSILATLGSCLCMGGIVWQLTRSRLGTLLAVLLVAMPFRYTGMWFDVARVDSAWTFFLLATICALVRSSYSTTTVPAVLAAVLFTCAVYTKQTSLFLFPFFALATALWSGISIAIVFAFVCGLLIVLVGSYFQWQSDGLFYFMTMEMAGNHNMTRGIPNHFFKGDLLEAVPVFFVLVVVWLIDACKQTPRIGLGWVVVVTGILGMTLLARMYAGGFKNVTMPMHFLIATLSVPGFALVLARDIKGSHYWRKLKPALWSVLFLLNLVFSAYVPQWSVPTAEDRTYGDALVKRIAAVPGRVCLSRDAYLAYLAGKEFCAHETQLTDILNGGNQAIADSVIADARKRIMGGYYEVLIVDSITDIGNYVNVKAIPYVGTPLDKIERDKRFYPVNGGPKPQLWLDVWPERTTQPDVSET